MKNFFKNRITLISAIIIFILSIAWCIYDIGFEPIIGLIASTTTIITSSFMKFKERKNDNNISITNVYSQINTTINKFSNEIDSIKLNLPKDFLKTLPIIKHNTYLKAQPLWDSGITSNMIEGNNFVIEKLLHIYLDLVDLIENKESVKELYTKQIDTYAQYVNEAQPLDGGTIHLVMAGGTLSNIIDDCIVSMIEKNTDVKFFNEWLVQWNNYNE